MDADRQFYNGGTNATAERCAVSKKDKNPLFPAGRDNFQLLIV